MGIPLESAKGNYVAQLAGPKLPATSKGQTNKASRNGNSTKSTGRQTGRLGTDAIAYYLSSIGRVPLLTPAEEIHLAHDVQVMKKHLEKFSAENEEALIFAEGAELTSGTYKSKEDIEKTKISNQQVHKNFKNLFNLAIKQANPKDRRKILSAKRSRDRMMAANLRLVVSVAKKYQNQGLELLDLVQEGAIGLERAVDKFDPAMGYKFSTYAYWWIRQGMTRAIDNSARTIRLPIHISEKLSKMRRISRELSHRFGRQPNRLELAHAMGIEPEDLEDLVAQSAPCASLDAHARGEDDRSTLGELIPDPNGTEPMEGMDRNLQKEHLGGWLSQLNEREQKILRLRFGLDGEEGLTLAEIGRQINVSRERVRQLEARAILKLRGMASHHQAA